MRPFKAFPAAQLRQIRYVLTDVDDTLTDGPRLPAAAYSAIERLGDAGITVIPVTAAPSGWCDLMARMWPIGAVIGENGGLCFRRDPAADITERYYWSRPAKRETVRARLADLAADIAAALPGAEIAHDQRYRETTLAFRNLATGLSEQILARLAAAGARTTLNSMWLLAWFGEFDKLAMARRMMPNLFGLDLEREAESCLYVGDSPNDAPMFDFFAHSVGVASLRRYAMPTSPRWITEGGGGAGFVEVADRLLVGLGR
jgi:HAD superfamily hydrolase (TIGR01484 family)